MSFNAKASVIKVAGNLVTARHISGTVLKNEVAYVQVDETTKLKSEIIRIIGDRIDMQVFEDTKGIHVGAPVEFTGMMLSVELGPGLLNTVFDGLQNPLNTLADKHGFFLPRGVYYDALDRSAKWPFTPLVKKGDQVHAGSVIGTVPEGAILHKIMVPFDMHGLCTVESIEQGTFHVNDTICVIKKEDGTTAELNMITIWPVKKSLTQYMQKQRFVERLFPNDPLPIGCRIIDTFFPIAKGGTACVPGPFGSGKTVLQQTMAKYADAEIVIVVACGERAGEVVETLKEFPEITDPRTGRSLMERTIIICNTSSMPVAAREASIYTGLTLGEYYRQMGISTLLIADSTSRWAQALREMSARLEEIPGEEAFPAYLDSAIKNLYERAGLYRTCDGSIGALTMVGTVSPAGGNFEEPVTQSTLATVKCFLGLSYNRAYKRFYPAIEPLISWSRYLKQMENYFRTERHDDWVDNVQDCIQLLKDGDSINQMMQVSGEEGISMSDYIKFQKSLFIDMVYLQQDAFDSIEAYTSPERQKDMFIFVNDILGRTYKFVDKKEVLNFFTQITGLFKNMNYTEYQSERFNGFRKQIEEIVSDMTA